MSVKTTTALSIHQTEISQAVLQFRIINNITRRQILQFIDQNKEITVTEIYIRLRLEQPVASQHLAQLKKAGLVNARRDGKFIYYSVNYGGIQHFHAIAAKLLS